ncbi:hypothetical protein [Solemya velesiana gill symbiont]|nr:hypothetical protein [Solemya velesiana gill symbiont]
MHYWVQKESNGLRIDIDASKQAKLLDCLNSCLAGNPGCEINLGGKLESMQVEQDDNEIRLCLKHSAGNDFDSTAIHECLKRSTA